MSNSILSFNKKDKHAFSLDRIISIHVLFKEHSAVNLLMEQLLNTINPQAHSLQTSCAKTHYIVTFE